MAFLTVLSGCSNQIKTYSQTTSYNQSNKLEVTVYYDKINNSITGVDFMLKDENNNYLEKEEQDSELNLEFSEISEFVVDNGIFPKSNDLELDVVDYEATKNAYDALDLPKNIERYDSSSKYN